MDVKIESGLLCTGEGARQHAVRIHSNRERERRSIHDDEYKFHSVAKPAISLALKDEKKRPQS